MFQLCHIGFTLEAILLRSSRHRTSTSRCSVMALNGGRLLVILGHLFMFQPVSIRPLLAFSCLLFSPRFERAFRINSLRRVRSFSFTPRLGRSLSGFGSARRAFAEGARFFYCLTSSIVRRAWRSLLSSIVRVRSSSPSPATSAHVGHRTPAQCMADFIHLLVHCGDGASRIHSQSRSANDTMFPSPITK